MIWVVSTDVMCVCTVSCVVDSGSDVQYLLCLCGVTRPWQAASITLLILVESSSAR